MLAACDNATLVVNFCVLWVSVPSTLYLRWTRSLWPIHYSATSIIFANSAQHKHIMQCLVLLVGQAHRTATEAVYWWHSSWNLRRNIRGFLWKLGWNCRLCCYERRVDWEVCIVVGSQ